MKSIGQETAQTAQKIIGVREFSRSLKNISRETKRGVSFLVMRNTEPLFYVEPFKQGEKKGAYMLKDLTGIRFKSEEKNLSRRIDEIVYGI
ncbi:hypothetical protein L0Y46_01060 [bacterium]|nr:hypothetical protein [bacterium]MCI0680110.1 hypothetical protein [bacterium]